MPKIKKPEVDVTDALNKVAEALVRIESKLEPVSVRKLETPVNVNAESHGQPVPHDYRELTNTILNKSFDLDIEYAGDTPTFTFTVLVPEKYSHLSPDYRKMYGGDRRPKVINLAEGLNGVRIWLEKVYQNFDQDTKALIAMDRVQL
jgi:hypothetical protein